MQSTRISMSHRVPLIDGNVVMFFFVFGRGRRPKPYRVYPFPVAKVGARDFVVRGLLFRVTGAIYFLSPFAVLAVLSVYLEFLGAKWGFAG